MNTKGFTLLETLVAVTILTISIAGPLYSAGRSLSAARNASNELTASYLAQEGIEYVRMMRDNEFLIHGTNAGWTYFISQQSGLGYFTVGPCKKQDCYLDVQTNPAESALSQCPNNGCTAPVPNFPLFVRSIRAADITTTPVPTLCGSPLSSKCEETITVTVAWKYGNTNYSITTVDHLTPWQ